MKINSCWERVEVRGGERRKERERGEERGEKLRNG